LLAVVNGEVEPKAMTRVARVRPETQVVLELANEQDIPEVSRLERGIEAQIA
jgi:hypothetical protein